MLLGFYLGVVLVFDIVACARYVWVEFWCLRVMFAVWLIVLLWIFLCLVGWLLVCLFCCFEVIAVAWLR